MAKSNKYIFCYYCNTEHLESEFTPSEKRYCRMSVRARSLKLDARPEFDKTYSVREKQDSGLALYHTREHIQMRERESEDCLRNRLARTKSESKLAEIIRGVIADEAGRKAAMPNPPPIITWEKFQLTRMVNKTY